MKQVDVHTLHKLLGKVNLIEVRESCEVNGGKIPTSEIVLSIGLRMNDEVFLDKTKEYYVACLSDYNNYALAKLLNSKGYKITNVIG